MSELLTGVVVSHASVGPALVQAVEAITGKSDVLIALSNDGCSGATLAERVDAAVGHRPCIVFVDLAGGSCFRAAASLVPQRPGLRVIAGVNLPMLLDFVYHRDVGVDIAAARAVESGTNGIYTTSQ